MSVIHDHHYYVKSYSSVPGQRCMVMNKTVYKKYCKQFI